MARPTKLNQPLIERLYMLLSAGCNIDDACAEAGIAKQTFYNWKREALRLQQLGDAAGNALATAEDVSYWTFLDSLTRAQSRARVMAVMAVRTGLIATEQVETHHETFTETRFRKNEKGVEVAYEYRRTINKRVVREIPPDWRAGIEFLKRRMPEEWSDRVQVLTWQDRAVDDIRAGLIAFEDLAEAFDIGIATDLFTRAGIPVQARTGKT